MTAARQADQWNANHPEGTPVYAWPGTKDGAPLLTTTRSLAWVIASTPVVMVEGAAGGIALTHVLPRPSTVIAMTKWRIEYREPGTAEWMTYGRATSPNNVRAALEELRQATSQREGRWAWRAIREDTTYTEEDW